MLHLLFGVALAAPLVALVIPLMAVSRLSSGIVTSGGVDADRRRKRGCSSVADDHSEWGVSEFAFAHAVQAYEKLIDDTARRLP
jgi:hypothetical protein